MVRDGERVERIRSELGKAGLDAVVCALPANTLMLSGYWPLMGTALTIATRHGEVALVAPREEADLARAGWADTVVTFPHTGFEASGSAAPETALDAAARALGLGAARVGYEAGPGFASVARPGVYLHGGGMRDLLERVLPAAVPIPSDPVLARLRMWKTPYEVERIRAACRIAASAFREGANFLRAGQRESEAAAGFEASLAVRGTGCGGSQRCGGVATCLSGPNAAGGHSPYARSDSRAIELNETVIVHCAAYADGYWTDVTRTYCVGAPGERERGMFEAVLAARAAALEAIRPGVRASEVDAAARRALATRACEGDACRATGHGVGFGAAGYGDLPRVHPRSEDVLQAGMVLSLAPALYVEHQGGVRHGDVVVVTPTGAEVLSPFQAEIREMLLP